MRRRRCQGGKLQREPLTWSPVPLCMVVPSGSQAFVVVKDTGMGMSPEESARAFDYAFRGRGAVASGRRGKGLGLAVTKEILEANGGKISLSSEAGYGSEVTILLPFQRGAR